MLIDSGASFRYASTRVPRPGILLGRSAVIALGSDSLPETRGALPSLQEATMELPSKGSGRFGVTDTTGKCNCDVVVGDSRKERVSALIVETPFQIKADVPKILLVKARYQDSIAILINGNLVASRNTPDDNNLAAPAARPHGVNWETIRIPTFPGLLRKGKNSLRAIVRPSSIRLGPALEMELHESSTPSLLQAPVIGQVTENTAVVQFETDIPSSSSVVFWEKGKKTKTIVPSTKGLRQRHSYSLTDLPRGKTVVYEVLINSAVKASSSFRTGGHPDKPIHFSVYGDMRDGHKIHEQILRSIERDNPDFVLVTGDLVHRGTDEGDWQRFFAITGNLLSSIPYYPVTGNHDLGKSGVERRRMTELFPLWPKPSSRPANQHYYSFDVGFLHIVMLDSNSYEKPEQLQWLESDLAAATTAKKEIIAVTHDGPFSRGTHGGNKLAREVYMPLFEKYGVGLLLAGHDHLYQRGKVGGLRYFVSGGGGAALYNIRCGTRKKKPCTVKDGMEHVAKAYHYIDFMVDDKQIKACTRNPDGSALEARVRWSRSTNGEN